MGVRGEVGVVAVVDSVMTDRGLPCAGGACSHRQVDGCASAVVSWKLAGIYAPNSSRYNINDKDVCADGVNSTEVLPVGLLCPPKENEALGR